MPLYKTKQSLDTLRVSTKDKLGDELVNIENRIKDELYELENVGEGEEIYKGKLGKLLLLKTLLNGSNVTFEIRDEEIIINCPTVSGQGTVENAYNLLPSGVESFDLFNWKQDTTLNFRSLVPRTNMGIEQTHEALYLDALGDPITEAAADVFAYNNFF